MMKTVNYPTHEYRTRNIDDENVNHVTSTQMQKKYPNHFLDKNSGTSRWNRIKQDRLKKLDDMTDVYLDTLVSSIPKARLNMWCELNQIAYSKNQARQIFRKAIAQSYVAYKTTESRPNIIFHRDVKAEFTDQIYKQLFCKLDPKMEMSEEICKYLDV